MYKHILAASMECSPHFKSFAKEIYRWIPLTKRHSCVTLLSVMNASQYYFMIIFSKMCMLENARKGRSKQIRLFVEKHVQVWLSNNFNPFSCGAFNKSQSMPNMYIYIFSIIWQQCRWDYKGDIRQGCVMEPFLSRGGLGIRQWKNVLHM